MNKNSFHIYGMKELDYLVKLMATYGIDEQIVNLTTKYNYRMLSQRKNQLVNFFVILKLLVTILNA